jgi:hypothetical protein
MGTVRVFRNSNRTEIEKFKTEPNRNRKKFEDPWTEPNWTDAQIFQTEPNWTDAQIFQTEPNRTEKKRIFKISTELPNYLIFMSIFSYSFKRLSFNLASIIKQSV